MVVAGTGAGAGSGPPSPEVAPSVGFVKPKVAIRLLK